MFTDKSGPEIEAQLYSFEDKKGEKLALRPEHTVSKLRVVSGDKSIVFPLKAYSIGNVWRYEDTKKGRWREFIQADVDVFGSSNILYDSEVIACIDFALKKLNVKDYKINVSNRKILTSLMEDLQIKIEDEVQVLREIDKIHKIGMDEVIKRISAIIGEGKAESIREYLNGKEAKGKGVDELNLLMNDLKKTYGIKNVYFDRSLVRGQDYYDGTIFEFEFINDKFKGVALAGGGRYDRLSKNFDSDFPITGGSIGFDVVMEVLLDNFENTFRSSFCVINIDEIDKARLITNKLREAGIMTDILLDSISLSKGLDYCNSKRIKYAIIVGKRDLQDGKVTVRDLENKTEFKFEEDKLSDEIKTLLSR